MDDSTTSPAEEPSTAATDESTRPEPPVSVVDQQQRAIDWIARFSPRGQKLACPLCQTDDWAVTQTVFLHTLAHPDVETTHSLYPVFQLICTTCGYTMLFNAITAGTIPLGDSSDTGSGHSVDDQDSSASEPT